MNAADIRELFPGLNDTIYLNTATMGVGCAPAREAYERAGEETRGIFAELVGAHPEEIAIVPAVSTAAGIVAANLPSAKRGENVVVAENEFTSNYFPWLLLRERGYEVRAVPATAEGASLRSGEGHRGHDVAAALGERGGVGASGQCSPGGALLQCRG